MTALILVGEEGGRARSVRLTHPLEHVAAEFETWTIMFVAEYRCGPGSGRMPSSGQCAASVVTLSQAGGPNATATSSLSMQRSLIFACS